MREHVSIGAHVRIGDRFIGQPGARIGGDGFSFVTPEKSNVETARESLGGVNEAEGQAWARIASLGAVLIGDDVEVGANSTIDSGTIRPTSIGDRTKIDNLVHIGHNCVLGTDGLICGMVGLAGSVGGVEFAEVEAAGAAACGQSGTDLVRAAAPGGTDFVTRVRAGGAAVLVLVGAVGAAARG